MEQELLMFRFQQQPDQNMDPNSQFERQSTQEETLNAKSSQSQNIHENKNTQSLPINQTLDLQLQSNTQASNSSPCNAQSTNPQSETKDGSELSNQSIDTLIPKSRPPISVSSNLPEDLLNKPYVSTVDSIFSFSA